MIETVTYTGGRRVPDASVPGSANRQAQARSLAHGLAHRSRIWLRQAKSKPPCAACKAVNTRSISVEAYQVRAAAGAPTALRNRAR